jgi:hypothetical protein
LIDKLKMITQKNREQNLEQMMRILIEGANEQIKYQNIDLVEDGSDAVSEEIDFYDI